MATRVETLGAQPRAAERPLDELTLVSANLAHGRGRRGHQVFKNKRTLEANLRAFGAWLEEVGADLVCAQEADAASWWSGRFDHVAALAERAGHAQIARSCSVDRAGLRYGTALLSRWQLEDARAHTFAPTPPTPKKGFVISSMSWPGAPDFVFDVVSVHTDFSRARMRRRQVEELAQVVRQRGRPVVIAGDLNSDWRASGATRALTELLGLQAFEPLQPMVTFPSAGRRLDWVLVSSELELRHVEAVDLGLSDHRPLLAKIRRA